MLAAMHVQVIIGSNFTQPYANPNPNPNPNSKPNSMPKLKPKPKPKPLLLLVGGPYCIGFNTTHPNVTERVQVMTPFDVEWSLTFLFGFLITMFPLLLFNSDTRYPHEPKSPGGRRYVLCCYRITRRPVSWWIMSDKSIKNTSILVLVRVWWWLVHQHVFFVTVVPCLVNFLHVRSCDVVVVSELKLN